MTQSLADLVQDLRYAARGLRAHAGFAATAIVTLALGIGANTAMFSVVDGVVLRPLPFADPDRLVEVYETTALTPAGAGVGQPLRDALAGEAAPFEASAVYGVSGRYARGLGGPPLVTAVNADRTLFTVLGVAPIAGRTFQPDDPATVVVVGAAFWKERLGSDPRAVGRTIVLDGEPFTIVGVMPEGFQFPYAAASVLTGVATERRTDLWMPFGPPGQPARGRPGVVARLKAGVALAAAQDEASRIAQRAESGQPQSNRGRGVRLAPLADAFVGASVRRPLFILFGAVALVLALACANVTNLSLVRMTLRRREIAIRAALGAGPLRVMRQLLAESLLIASLGGAVGLVLAWWGTRRLAAIVFAQLPRAREVGLDWRVFVFSLAACAATGLLFGLAPAVIAMRADARSALQDSSGHATMSGGQRRLRDGLVVAEIALAFALAAGAVLLVRELTRLRRTDPGMVVDGVVTYHVGQRMTPQTDPRQYEEIAGRVARLPGVRAAGVTQLLPLQNWGWTSNSTDFRVRGRPAPPVFPIELRYVTTGYFQALGIPLRRGRWFTPRDDRGAPPVVLINETLARRMFGGADPVGETTTRGTIVGVVGDVHQVHLDRSASPEIYYPIAQNWSQLSEVGMSLVVRGDGSLPTIAAVRGIVRDVNPDLAIFDVKTMETVVDESLAGFTLYLWLMGGFAVLALVLAATGTYGVMAYVGSSRRREFAVRVALGADRARVTALIVGQGSRLTAIGIAAGWLVTLAAAPLLQNLPVIVRPPDAAVAAVVAAGIAAVAMVACVAPALRAARVDPMVALRAE